MLGREGFPTAVATSAKTKANVDDIGAHKTIPLEADIKTAATQNQRVILTSYLLAMTRDRERVTLLVNDSLGANGTGKFLFRNHAATN
jgi:hypothetical protein